MMVDVRFDLRCDPPAGTVSNPVEACARIAASPEMTSPPEMTGTCAGSYGIPPSFAVRGVAGGRSVNFAVRGCDMPAARREAAEFWRAVVGLGAPAGEPRSVEPMGSGGG
jgi:hypothetical protein